MFRLITDRRVLLSAALIGALVGVALWPRTVAVELATVTSGPLTVTADDEGRTRVRERYIVAAPTTGRVLRIELAPGDRVTRGAVVARLQPEPPTLLDARASAEASAILDSARAAVGRARAEEQRARAALAHAQRELARTRGLTAAGAASVQDLERREAEEALASAAANAASFAASAASADVARAQARVTPPAPAGRGAIVVVRSPVDGTVLSRLRESEGTVPAGEPLLVIGNPGRLEIVVDLLSTDAVRVAPGARATVSGWGGDSTLDAIVRLVEPSGFTATSALGVDEQRVNVVLDLVDAAACAPLGDAYRADVSIVLWEAPDVIRVPTSALFRDGERWAVFVARNGRAQRTFVELGHQTGQEAEVLAGLSAGESVIVHPPDRIRDGVRIQARD